MLGSASKSASKAQTWHFQEFSRLCDCTSPKVEVQDEVNCNR